MSTEALPGPSLVTRLVREVTDELGSAPTLGEFLEILSVSVPDALDPAPLPLVIRPKLRGRRRYPAGESRVAELGDAPFSAAADLLAGLAEAVQRERGRPASPAEVAVALLDSLRSAGNPFADVEVADIASLDVPKNGPSAKAKRGDVVAIPLGAAGYRLAVVVARNRFGLALGLLDGVSPVPAVTRGVGGAAGYPAYTDDHLLTDRTWKLVGHDEALLSGFPAEPEIFHSPDPIFPTDVGPYGAAESPDGRIRRLDEREAAAMGLLDGSYEQGYLSSHPQRLLTEAARDHRGGAARPDHPPSTIRARRPKSPPDG